MKRFIILLLSLCMLSTCAFAEEVQSESIFDPIGGWFSQAVEDVSNWTSQVWDDTTSWVSNSVLHFFQKTI